MKTFSAVGLLAIACFLLGRFTAPDDLVAEVPPRGEKVATFSGGALGADEVRGALTGAEDAGQRRAAVEQLVRTRLLAQAGEAAKLHLTPEFLQRY